MSARHRYISYRARICSGEWQEIPPPHPRGGVPACSYQLQTPGFVPPRGASRISAPSCSVVFLGGACHAAMSRPQARVPPLFSAWARQDRLGICGNVQVEYAAMLSKMPAVGRRCGGSWHVGCTIPGSRFRLISTFPRWPINGDHISPLDARDEMHPPLPSLALEHLQHTTRHQPSHTSPLSRHVKAKVAVRIRVTCAGHPRCQCRRQGRGARRQAREGWVARWMLGGECWSFGGGNASFGSRRTWIGVQSVAWVL
jgi:hypothetical protein